jgi:HAD superfamily hydrolase (TIGR01509 family)
MSFECFIFDFDGVLCNSEKIHKSCLVDSLAFHSYEWDVEKENLYQSFKDKKTIKKLEAFANLNLISEKDVTMINATKQSLTLESIKLAKLNAEVLKMLKLLKNINKKIGIASDSNLSTITSFLGSNECLHLFDSIVTNDLIKGITKPSPEVYLRSLEILNSDPNKTVVFEDTDEGVISAKLAGITNVYYCTYNNLYDILNKIL